jgi:hypothetical protein
VTVDALFPGVPCKDATGEFTPGPLDPKAAQQLPPDSVFIVAQLVLWLPFDDRLFWLLGEVANARDGDYNLSYEVLKELEGPRNFIVPEVRAHRKVLQQARLAANTMYYEMKVDKLRRAGLEGAHYTLAPLHSLLPPGVLWVVDAAGWAQTVEKLEREPSPPPESASSDNRSTVPPPKYALDWRQILTGFAIGIVLALLGVLQVRQSRRRRGESAGVASVSVPRKG